jgi:hypothetical protein
VAVVVSSQTRIRPAVFNHKIQKNFYFGVAIANRLMTRSQSSAKEEELR